MWNAQAEASKKRWFFMRLLLPRDFPARRHSSDSADVRPGRGQSHSCRCYQEVQRLGRSLRIHLIDFSGDNAMHDERIDGDTRLVVFTASPCARIAPPAAGVSEPTQRNTPSAKPLAIHSLCAAMNTGAAARFPANFNLFQLKSAPLSLSKFLALCLRPTQPHCGVGAASDAGVWRAAHRPRSSLPPGSVRRFSALAVKRRQRSPAKGKLSVSCGPTSISSLTLSRARARCKRVFTVSGRMPSSSAVSSTLIPSMIRMTSTIRKCCGKRSIALSSKR